MQAVMDHAAGLGAVTATLEVASSNAVAQAFYSRSGFLITGRRRGYYANGDDALLHSRSIGRGRDFRTDRTE